MDPKKVITSSAVAAMLAFAATSAFAQRNDRSDNRDPGREASRRPGDQRGSQQRAVPRQNAPQANAPRENAPRENAPRENVPRERNGRPWQDRGAGGGRRQDFRGGGGQDFREADRRREFESRRSFVPWGRPTERFRRPESPRFYTPRAYRPGLSLGFGVFFGSPYRYAFPGPSYGYDYGYSRARPGIAYGGISFGISPGDAEVYVDGDYVGIVQDFGYGAQPMTLVAGMHRIELDRRGYEPMAFDVDVVPGQVTPFNGVMRPGY